MTERHERPTVFDAHREECGECSRDEGVWEEIGTALSKSVVAVNPDALTARAMFALELALESNAGEALWRRAVTALTLAVVPLPLVLAWDAYLLGALHEWLGGLLPGPVATYMTFSYAALLALLLAGTYAAIPLSIGRGRRFAPAPTG